jgi:hypothetical protein
MDGALLSHFSGAKTGKDNGFSVLFDIESYDYGYYDEGSEGLKVAIVHHLVSRCLLKYFLAVKNCLAYFNI